MSSSNFNLVPGTSLRTAAAQASQPTGDALGRKILQDLLQAGPLRGSSAPSWLSAYLAGLQQERDPELLFQGLLRVAQRLKAEARDGAAQWIFGRLAQADLPAWVQTKAAKESSAWTGGAFGMQTEILLSRFCDNATDWRVIAPMLGASLVGQFVGTAALGRFAVTARGSLPWVAEGLGARLAAGTLGYIAEVPTFAGLSRALVPFPQASLSEDLARSALSLGALKVFGGVGNAGARWVTPAGAAPGASALMVSQFSGLFGLMSAHKLEEHLGLRPKTDGGTLLLDSAAALVSLGVGARLGRDVLGEGFARFQGDLEFRSRMLQRPFAESSFDFGKGLTLAMAGPGRPPGGDGKRLTRPWVLMSSNQGGGGKGRDSLAPVELSNIFVDPSLSGDPYLGRSFDNRYKIEALLGEGGMGKVYLATHEILGKKVAIKVLRESMAADKEATERFLNEARAASEIGNPHIVDVSDFGKLPDGATYFVMEHLDGSSLASLVAGGEPVPVPRLLHIAVQLAEGMSAAHQAGIVHRDLKPDNVFLVNRGKEKDFVKVLDFGIAKIAKYSSRRLTQEGVTFGSVHYMSPEQAMGIPVDPRSDVYAFGILLFEMASGKLPFDSEDKVAILNMHVGKAPPLLSDVSSQQIPPELEALIARCLAKRPEDRYQSMEEVSAELERMQAELFPKPPSDPALKPISDRAPSVAEPVEPGIRKPSSGRGPVAPEIDPEATQIVSERRRLQPRTDSAELVPPRRRWRIFAGLGIGGAGAGAVAIAAAILTSNRAQPTSADAPPATPDANKAPQITPLPPPEDAPPPVVSKKEISLSVSPSDAHVFLDGKDLGSKAVSIELETGATVKLEIRRRGFKTKKLELDGSQESLTVQLDREFVPKKPPPPKDPPKKPPTSEVISPWK